MVDMFLRRRQGNLEFFFLGNGVILGFFFIILGGVSIRMTNRILQEFFFQFCGRIRRLMYTCRFSRVLEVQLVGIGKGIQYIVVIIGSWGFSYLEFLILIFYDFRQGEKRLNGMECFYFFFLNWVGQFLQGYGMFSFSVIYGEVKCGGLVIYMMQSYDCWYCIFVIVVVIFWMVFDSIWIKDRVQGNRKVG